MEDNKDLYEIETLLVAPLDPENGHNLAHQLVEVEAWLSRVSKLCYEAGATLNKMRDKYRVPKTPGLTDLDRTVMLDAAVADYEATYKHLEAMQDTIRRRCTLGQSLLRNLRTEIEGGIR